MKAASTFEERIRSKFADVVRKRSDMHHYQTDIALPFLRKNPFSALFVGMGLGKTVSTATLIVDLLEEFTSDDPVLIIGPLRVATDTWPTEFTLWEHLAPYNVEVVHAFEDDPTVATARALARVKAKADAAYWELDKLAAQKFVQHQVQRAETAAKVKVRKRATRSKKSIHVISRDWIEWLVNYWGPLWPYRTVIIDESSGFKDHASGRFKALAKVRRTPGLITRLHELTATPSAESYEHLFAQVYLMDMGERLGKNITNYRKRYFTHNRWSLKWELRPGAEEDILAKIADICLVMEPKDYLPDLPEPVIVQRPVRMTAEEMNVYATMQKNFLVRLPDGSEVEAETAAALSAKLLQIASGVLYETRVLEDWDTGDRSKITHVHHIHDHKIDALRDIVEEAQGSPLLVAYHFKSSLARLQKAFPKAILMDKDGKCIKQWNKGKIPMLLVHPQSTGHGLNLQHGGHNLVFFDIPWSLELYLQTIGRLARQGQVNPVVVQLLTSVGTLDEVVFSALSGKKDAQAMMFRILKTLFKKLHTKTR